MNEEEKRYEEWLTTIANTRLIYNTIGELEAFLDAPSIHSNGIKRCLATPQRMRSAFRDLAVEVESMTDGEVNLEQVMLIYKKAWGFFRENLSRRTDPFGVALELLRYFCPPYSRAKLGKKKAAIFEKMEKQDVNLPFVLLMLLKIVPGYDSKEGDVDDMAHQYEYAMTLLDKFTEGGELFSTLPVITRAREAKHKSRITLLYHLTRILDEYVSYAEQANLYDVSADVKQRRVYLDLEGFWNVSGAGVVDTHFWQIENAQDGGTYIATRWYKDAENNLKCIRYSMFMGESINGSMTAYIMHPEAIKHRMSGLPYGDSDHVWYGAEMPSTYRPDVLNLSRLMASTVWDAKLNLTRITDEGIIGIYNKWLETCNIVNKFAQFEYEFHPDIAAITKDAIYIPTGEAENEYYQVPRNAFEGAERISMDDNVGIMTMNGHRYIVFDEFLLFIPTTRAELKKYGITKRVYENIEVSGS